MTEAHESLETRSCLFETASGVSLQMPNEAMHQQEDIFCAEAYWIRTRTATHPDAHTELNSCCDG